MAFHYLRRLRFVGTAALSCAALLASSPSFAHHGWSWADGDQVTLEGTVEAISMAPPHPTLRVKDDQGVWQVDLGNPAQTQRSGFTGETTKIGEAIIVTGNRAKDHSKLHMKAVRITLDGKHYDMYPERLNK